MPTKPVVEVGALDCPADQVIVGKSDGSDKVRRESLSNYDKATCFKPREWEQYKAYMKLLENFISACQPSPTEVKR